MSEDKELDRNTSREAEAKWDTKEATDTLDSRLYN